LPYEQEYEEMQTDDAQEPEYITLENQFGDSALVTMSDDFVEYYITWANSIGLTNRSILEESAHNDVMHLSERTIDLLREQKLGGINRPLIFHTIVMPHNERNDCITVKAIALGSVLDDGAERVIEVDYIMEPGYPVKEIRQ
jgi:hypothetical protein